MKKFFSLLVQAFSAFLESLSPPQRRTCPHCGGGKCCGACQFLRKDGGEH